MNRLDALFQHVRSHRQPAFLAFLTAGDPDLPTTVELAKALAERARRRGVPLILEIGFPYSDPIADGPTIQTSYTRALNKHVRVGEIMAAVAGLRKESDVPLVAMVSYSLVLRRGVEAFLASARQAGFDGLIIPDLPVEESAEVHRIGQEQELKIVQLIAPTTPPERAKQIARESTGFLYYVSVTGITGERTELPTGLPDRLDGLRRLSDLPVCVGFGISRPEHVAMLRDHVDGVIVGSAIVRRLESLTSEDAKRIASVADFVDSLLAPLAASPAQ